ncbi:MAG: DUF3078 domain-containing protein [Paramuribaculum sp.]|nr:DUF3078 domain-containing protein [Paramuribaculum sp.]
MTFKIHLSQIAGFTVWCLAMMLSVGAEASMPAAPLSPDRDQLTDTLIIANVDSIYFSDGMAIHPADTLNIHTSRYFATYTPAYDVPLIFDNYNFYNGVSIRSVELADSLRQILGPDADWLIDIAISNATLQHARQNYMTLNPDRIVYNLSQMPSPPTHYNATVTPGSRTINVYEIKIEPAKTAENITPEVKQFHWLRNFDASLDFSQAYISPNWYQGGSNNLNILGHVKYNVRLNEKFHPNLKFDTTVEYRVGVNNAPDDTTRKYNITEDLFQLYTNFGYKAAHNWYYSVTGSFKTQLLKNYASNSHNLKAAFLSPGTLSVGIGMTYSKNTKNCNFSASINPLAYELKTCINEEMNPTSQGIPEGKKTKSSYGSNTELKFVWRLRYNITYNSRLYMFTNYDYAQGDWENTMSFDINRFLRTKIQWHVRYDTQTRRLPDSDWHRFQLKEILSFGVSYKFSNV